MTAWKVLQREKPNGLGGLDAQGGGGSWAPREMGAGRGPEPEQESPEARAPRGPMEARRESAFVALLPPLALPHHPLERPEEQLQRSAAGGDESRQKGAPRQVVQLLRGPATTARAPAPQPFLGPRCLGMYVLRGPPVQCRG